MAALKRPAVFWALEKKPMTTKMIYTCPMHPEVQKEHRGYCPKCGMTLEAKTVKVGVDMESAGITLVKGDLRGIAKAIRLSRATMRNIRQNLFFTFLYNALGIPVAAGVLYPFFGLLLSPIIAGAAMSLSSVSVITNALRLKKVKL
jgi:hypothetical protein